MWSVADIADAVQAGLHNRFAALDAEHAVYGLDARDEVQLHPILAEALKHAGLGVYREQRYPSDRHKRRDSEGERCDLVLTPDGRALQQAQHKATLFEPTDAVEPDDAFWLEVKVVAQYTPEGPNRHYSSELLSTVSRDVTKLARDQQIIHAGLLIVLFVEDQKVAAHDLGVWQDRCLKKSLPIAAPAQRTIALTDRHGNGCCTIALYPVKNL